MTVQPAWAARGACDLADLGARREQGHVPAGEVEMLEVLDLELLAAVAEVDDVAGRARGCDRRHFVHRELPFGEDVQHLPPDIARRSDDRDPIAHSKFSVPRTHLVRGARFTKTRATATVESASNLCYWSRPKRRAPRSSRDAPFRGEGRSSCLRQPYPRPHSPRPEAFPSGQSPMPTPTPPCAKAGAISWTCAAT